MKEIKTTAKHVVLEIVIKNLLSAQKRIADTGDVKALIGITKYLLRLANQLDNVIVDIGAECDQQWGNDPIQLRWR